MTEKGTSGSATTANNLWRAFLDLVILSLFLGGAGFGGYFLGVHQQLAPVQKVAPGTPGAIQAASVAGLPPPLDQNCKNAGSAESASGTHSQGKNEASSAGKAETKAEANAETKGDATNESATGSAASSAKTHGKKKFWITSSGTDYIGYSITAKVNGTAVDSFFGPGKIVDVSHLVKPGANTLECDAKELGEKYNSHSGDASSKLTLLLVSGPHITDTYKKSEVLLTYERTAADTEDANDTLHFTGD
jgi:hypothetical protein